MYEQTCTLCPRHCGVNRAAGETGFCGAGNQMKAARAALHFWEEPVLSGTNGAGTIFFSGCTLRCCYCQNAEISHTCSGTVLTSAQLRSTMENLIQQGAHNIELVTPTQFLPEILPALTPKLPVPVVYNTGGYESVETLRTLESYVDIWMPDIKYSNSELAKRLSGAADYVEVSKKTILEMYRQTGPYQIKNGLLKKGVLIRHLILPGEVDNSIDVLNWIGKTFPKHSILVSLMAQYIPYGKAKNMPPYDRKISRDEYDTVLSWLYLNGLEDGFTQGFEAASVEYIPAFDGTGLNVSRET